MGKGENAGYPIQGKKIIIIIIIQSNLFVVYKCFQFGSVQNCVVLLKGCELNLIAYDHTLCFAFVSVWPCKDMA